MSARHANVRPGASPAGPLAGLGCAIVALIAIVMMVHLMSGGQPSGPSGSGGGSPPVGTDGSSTPVRNPLDELLGASVRAAGAARDGVGVAILIDTSGSMSDAVPDTGGARRPKIIIARRCVTQLVRQVGDYAKKYPDRAVVLGLYEFSARDRGPNCRRVLPLAPPDVAAAERAVQSMQPGGGTPIGDAIIQAKQDLDASGYRRQHILVVTDGENNRGYAPGDVVSAMSRLPDDHRSAVYLVAFDVKAAQFAAIKDAGGLVLAAAGGDELQQTLDYILTGKILAEQPAAPGK